MAYKEKAQKTKYQNQYISATYDRINLLLPRGWHEIVKAAAARDGLSVNGYIRKLIELDNPGVFPISPEMTAAENPQVDESFSQEEKNESEN